MPVCFDLLHHTSHRSSLLVHRGATLLHSRTDANLCVRNPSAPAYAAQVDPCLPLRTRGCNTRVGRNCRSVVGDGKSSRARCGDHTACRYPRFARDRAKARQPGRSTIRHSGGSACLDRYGLRSAGERLGSEHAWRLQASAECRNSNVDRTRRARGVEHRSMSHFRLRPANGTCYSTKASDLSARVTVVTAGRTSTWRLPFHACGCFQRDASTGRYPPR